MISVHEQVISPIWKRKTEILWVNLKGVRSKVVSNMFIEPGFTQETFTWLTIYCISSLKRKLWKMWNGYDFKCHHIGLSSRKGFLEQHLQTLWKTKSKKAVSPGKMHLPNSPSSSHLRSFQASGSWPPTFVFMFFPGHKCPMVRLAHLPKPSQLGFRKIKLLTTL